MTQDTPSQGSKEFLDASNQARRLQSEMRTKIHGLEKASFLLIVAMHARNMGQLVSLVHIILLQSILFMSNKLLHFTTAI